MGIRLHLPNEWIQNPARLDRCGVPMAIRRSREKWETALDLLAEIRDLIPRSSVLILDENYGAMPPLLAELERRQANYVAKIPHDIRKWPFVLAECFAGRPTQPVTKRDWQAGIRRLCGWLWDLNLEGTPWRQIEVRGSGKQTLDMFAKPLVMAPSERPYDPKSERRWLFVLRKDEALFGNWDYYVSNLPLSTSPSELAEFALRLNATKERQRQLNSRLGLAHFEGRSWHGLHHHVTLCHLAGAFLSERERH